MLREHTKQMIKDALAELRHPVRLALFVNDVRCDACPAALELGRAIRAASPKVALEVYDQAMDRDKTELYGIERVPSFVVQAQDGRSLTFSGDVEGISLVLLLEAIAGAVSPRAWFGDQIAGMLGILRRPVHVLLFLENDCTLCRPVAETAVGLALTSRLVQVELIVADDYPDLLAKHRIRTLPFTWFGPKLSLEGHIGEAEFIGALLQAEGLQETSARRCAICAQPSSDVVCESCKTRIQSEAATHKRRDEHLSHPGTVVKPRQNP